jgi:hypothetical protein
MCFLLIAYSSYNSAPLGFIGQAKQWSLSIVHIEFIGVLKHLWKSSSPSPTLATVLLFTVSVTWSQPQSKDTIK